MSSLGNELLAFFNWSKLHSVFGTIAALISIVAFGVGQWLKRRKVEAKLTEKDLKLSEAEEEIKRKQEIIDVIQKAANSQETQLWDIWPKAIPAWFLAKRAHAQMRVITCANFKGGVGKTTIAANLAIALSKRGYRVLIIDFDYQGSLDSRLKVVTSPNSGFGSSSLLEPDGRIFDNRTTYKLGGDLEGISLIPASYRFAGLENRVMLQWLLQSTHDDLRFRLAEKILSAEAQKAYDVVVLDTPPRLSAGTVNALCASTDVIIPTIVDLTSIEAVTRFARTVRFFRERYNPFLKIRGVLPSMTHHAKLADYEEGLLEELDHDLEIGGVGAKVFRFNIPRKRTEEVALGEKQLYFAEDKYKLLFGQLANSLELPPLDNSKERVIRDEDWRASVSA